MVTITYINTNLYGSEFVIITVKGSQLTEILRTKTVLYTTFIMADGARDW